MGANVVSTMWSVREFEFHLYDDAGGASRST
jgi:hypothetical protein